MAIMRRLWPGTFLAIAAGYTALVLGTIANLQQVFGVQPQLLAQFTAAVVGIVYIFEPEIRGKLGAAQKPPENSGQ